MINQGALVAKLHGDNFFTKLNFSKGYWQIPLDESLKLWRRLRLKMDATSSERCLLGCRTPVQRLPKWCTRSSRVPRTPSQLLMTSLDTRATDRASLWCCDTFLNASEAPSWHFDRQSVRSEYRSRLRRTQNQRRRSRDGPGQARQDQGCSTTHDQEGSKIVPWACWILHEVHTELCRDRRAIDWFDEEGQTYESQMGTGPGLSLPDAEITA